MDWNYTTYKNGNKDLVASFVEAWIEIISACVKGFLIVVASFVEAWIEILRCEGIEDGSSVASFVEAWIEI